MRENEFSQIESDGLLLDFDRFESRLHGRLIEFTLTEFKILASLITQSGFVARRDQLLSVIAPHHHIDYRNVDVHIGSIRRKLGKAGRKILTVRGLGYKWLDDNQRYVHSYPDKLKKKFHIDHGLQQIS